MIAVALLFFALGFLIKYRKMYFLISGYNTMSAEEKSKYDIEGIANLFWHAMFGMALIIATGVILAYFLEQEKLEVYALILALVAGLPYLIIKSNAEKYKQKKNPKEQEGRDT